MPALATAANTLGRRRIAVVAVAGAISTLVLVHTLRPQGHPRARASRSASVAVAHDECRERHVQDDLGMLDGDRIHGALHAVCDQSDADIRVVTVERVPGDDLERFALGYMRDHGIGRLLHARGVVIVYERATNRMRIEVGPGLQGALPDGFIGYMMREASAQLFTHDPARAVASAIVILRYRIASAQIGEGYDPALVRRLTESLRLASGGGTSTSMDTRSAFIRHPATDAERELYGPQSTIPDTQGRYLLWLRDGALATDVPLFYGRTEQGLRMAQTRAGASFMEFMEDGQRYAVATRGDLGILVYTSTPLMSPSLFRRGPAGWQKDFAAELRDTEEWASSGFTWRMRDTGDDFSRTFADLFVTIDGVKRVASGDNRQLVSLFAGTRALRETR